MSDRYTNQQRFFIAAWYECFQSVVTVKRKFREKFGKNAKLPVHNTIKAIHTKLSKSGEPDDRPRMGRPISSRSDENISVVSAHITAHPETSQRRTSISLGMSKTTIQRILRQDLQLRPYKIRVLHELSEEDFADRLTFCEDMLQRLYDDGTLLERIVFSDEAHFHLSGQVTRHNAHIYARENPKAFTTKPLHSERVTVWMGIWSGGLIGPFLFDGNVTGQSYLAMLQTFLLPILEDLPVFQHQELFFMQDGAPPHWATIVRTWLNENFGEQWIGRGSPEIQWPARSPDLTPCDFWLWGHMKSLIYQTQPANLDELKRRIFECVSDITPETRMKALHEFATRLKKCVDNRGKHIE